MIAMVWLAASNLAAHAGTAGAEGVIPLAGTWRVRLDRADTGEREKWFAQTLADPVKLPGSLAENGLGDDVSVDTPWTGGIQDRSWFTEPQYEPYRRPGNVKLPFWLTPVKVYVGPAWYQRAIDIPEGWKGKKVWLFLERPHWETRVWIDQRDCGMQNSLSTPHLYDLGEVAPGQHRLTVRIDNRLKIDVGPDAHSVTDHTQTNWNGVVGRLELRATDPIWIDDVQLFPDIAGKKAKVCVTIGNATGQPAELLLDTSDDRKGISNHYMLDAGPRSTFTPSHPLEDSPLWDEFSPVACPLVVEVSAFRDGKDCADRREVTFGMRDFKTQGTNFTLNGRPVLLRGTLECCIFPRTGYPPTDVESWTRILKIARAHGLNHLRFHSWCPPEAAFEAADRLGFIYQIECAMWTHTPMDKSKAVSDFLYAETERILRAYGNHPSFCLLSHGNEPPRGQEKYLGEWVRHWRELDPRRLYTSGSGWPTIPESDYHVTPGPRIHAWGGGLKSRVNARPPETTTDYSDFIAKYPNHPVVSHEIGQWCVYPNFDEIKKYTGVTRAYNFEIFREGLRQHHMADQAHDFLIASGKLQTLLYKEEIESAMRTKGFGGFELLDLHDFPGQGTALVGVLDPFWEGKGYVTPEEFHRFACETVPLVRMAKRIWTADERFTASVEISHFGPKPLARAVAGWTICGQDGKAAAIGRLPAATIPLGNGTLLGEVSLPLAGIRAPQKLNLAVTIEGTPYANDWDFWVYPAAWDMAPGEAIFEAGTLEEALPLLAQGKKVLLVPRAGSVRGDRNGKVPPGFSSIFWNTAWTHRQPPHTLGILCDPKHPAFAAFPTESHSNWQWWELIHGSQIMILDGLPPPLRPVVQVIDDWVTNRRLGLVFEAKVGGGKLLVCGADIASDLASRPVARQFRRSLLEYMQGPGFEPRHEVTAAQLGGIFEAQAK
ncbi:MAG: sugar-binding domain-containing protein [Thermoguttaceae bacterium]